MSDIDLIPAGRVPSRSLSCLGSFDRLSTSIGLRSRPSLVRRRCRVWWLFGVGVEQGKIEPMTRDQPVVRRLAPAQAEHVAIAPHDRGFFPTVFWLARLTDDQLADFDLIPRSRQATRGPRSA